MYEVWYEEEYLVKKVQKFFLFEEYFLFLLNRDIHPRKYMGKCICFI